MGGSSTTCSLTSRRRRAASLRRSWCILFCAARLEEKRDGVGAAEGVPDAEFAGARIEGLGDAENEPSAFIFVGPVVVPAVSSAVSCFPRGARSTLRSSGSVRRAVSGGVSPVSRPTAPPADVLFDRSSSRSVPRSRVVCRRSSSDASEEEDETGAPASRRSDRDIALSVESASALPTVRIAARRPSRARSARDSIVPARLGNNAGDASSTKLQGESDPPAALPEGPSPWLGVPGEGMTLTPDAPLACRARPERANRNAAASKNRGCSSRVMSESGDFLGC